MGSAAVRILILDVDGVLTDGRVMLGPDGDDVKSFHVRDGCAIKLWQRCGGVVALLSGRKSLTVEKRGEELGISLVMTGVKDKLAGYARVLAESGLGDEAVAYLGDDLPDLGPMSRCEFPVATADAVSKIKRVAAYVTRNPGGHGAVAETVELLLREAGRYPREE
ncbi:MAG: phenylphosphate carboxylase subunit delta, partial [Planctomycetota bacterium]